MADKGRSEDQQFPHFGTLAIHAGQDPEQWRSKAVVPPISLSTTFKQDVPGKPDPYDYSRGGNPTRDVFEKCIATLEGGKHAIATSSGLAAQSLIIQLLKSGDHVLAMNDLYGGTYRYFMKVFSNFGVETTLVDMTDLNALEAGIKKNTKVLWVESLTNPFLRYIDIPKVVDLVKRKMNRRDIIVVVDNTFLTPYFQRPFDLGADIVYHSVTKYLNGHSDVCMGVICTKSDELGAKLRFLQMAAGPVPSPFDCFLANRGLKTLHIRMREHQKNAMAVAQYLSTSPNITEVMYPGLPSHPQHEVVKQQCKGFSGMVSIRIKGSMENAKKFLSAIKIFTLAESLGGYESLADHPATMTHASIPPEEREKLGISDTLIRLSIGLEDTQDLLDDLDQALKVSQL